MFTGIIETLGKVQALKNENDNLHISVQSSLTNELKIDQSVAHNGVCLTVIAIENDVYTVTAIAETINKTNLGDWQVGDSLNLERAMLLGARLDGHIVQGHVDQTGIVKSVKETGGSWQFDFEFDPASGNVTVEKGSVCINGVSLTCFNSTKNGFTVAIIPNTYQHTNFNSLKEGDSVNLEFDIVGKYVKKLLAER